MEWKPFNDATCDEATSTSGIIEVRYKDDNTGERLHIGYTNKLSRRIGYLIKGTGPHSVRDRMMAVEQKENLEVRWDEETNYQEKKRKRQQAHIDKFGHLPKYDKRLG